MRKQAQGLLVLGFVLFKKSNTIIMPNTFTFNREGVEEIVQRERYGWIAIYKDGSFLKQFDESNGTFHQFKEIDLANLVCFVMQNLDEPTNPSKRFEVHIKEGMKPIHYYQRGKLNVGQSDEVAYTLYCFGFEQEVGGRVAKTIMTIYPSGVIAVRNE